MIDASPMLPSAGSSIGVFALFPLMPVIAEPTQRKCARKLESNSDHDICVLNMGFAEGIFVKEKGEKALHAALDALEEGGTIMLRSGVSLRVTNTLELPHSVHICSARSILCSEWSEKRSGDDQSGRPRITLSQSSKARSLLRTCSSGMRVALTDITVESAAKTKARKDTNTRVSTAAFDGVDGDLIGTPHFLKIFLRIPDVFVADRQNLSTE
jgi:hypothetical protein